MFFSKSSGGAGWIVVFLGNPGSKYEKTRHNVGFMTADIIEKKEKIKINRSKFSALTALTQISGEKVFLIKPQTYMNLSGNAVAPAAAFYKVPSERVIVICDDVSLPLGKLRIRASGSAGGHNGLKSIISALGTQDFPRIKIGVGSPETAEDENAMANWVLGSFHGKDEETAKGACERASLALYAYLADGPDKAMNMFN